MGTISRRRFGVVVVGFLVIGVLLLVSVWIAFLWSVPSFATREFEFEDLRATLVVRFAANGPFSAGNEITGDSAVFYVLGFITTTGQVSVEIRGDTNSSGAIFFVLPPLESSDGSHSTSSTEGLGTIIPSNPGRIGLRAHAELIVNGSTWVGWSQYISSPLEPLDVFIETSPASDYYTFLAFKAVAASILVASAFAVFPAIESALKVAKGK